MPYVPYSPAPLTPPEVVVVPPPDVDVGTIVTSPTPTITGTAGDRASDSNTVVVEVLSGTSIVRSFNVIRVGADWQVVVTPALPNGDYTARAKQAWTGGADVVSVADPFTIAVGGMAGGFAVSQGPTGSWWGPDSTAVSGRPSITPRSMARGGLSFTQFAQAADWWWSVGINHKPDYIAKTQANYDKAIELAQELHITKFRFGLWTPTNHTDTSIQDAYQTFATRAAVLSTVDDPVMCLWGIGKEPESAVRDNGNQERWRYTPTTMARPLDHMSGANPTANLPGGGGPGNYQDIGWTSCCAVQGANEADTSYAVNWTQQRAWCRSFWQYKNTKTAEDALSIYGYVDSTTGRWTSQQAKAHQIPMVAGPLGSKTTGLDLGDWTARDGSSAQAFDYGSWSIYHYLEPHMVPNFVSEDIVDSGAEWDSFLNMLNGRFSPAGRFSRTIPIVVGETGFVSAPGADPVGAETASTNNAPRYIPSEVAGVYLNQSLIQHYCWGIKQQYVYKLQDEGFQSTPGGPAHGLCETDFRRKEAFFALKNLMRHIGRGQSSSPSTGQPISIPVVQTVRNGVTTAGWQPGAQNVDSLFPNTHTQDQFWRPVFQQDDDTYVMVLARNRPLWKRYSQVYITVPDPDDVTFQLPAGTWAISVAEPEKVTQTALDEYGQTTGQKWPPTYSEGSRRPMQDPDDGQAYPNPGDGMAYSATGISGVDDLTPDANNRITVRVAGLTRIVKLVRTQTDAFRTRVFNELDEFANWCEDYNVNGVIGEFGVPGNPGSSGYVAADAGAWAGLLGAYMDALEARNLSSLYWAAWPTPIYENAAYNAPGIGSDINTASSQAAPLEQHNSDIGMVRGIAMAGLSFGNNGAYSNTNPGSVNNQYFPPRPGSWSYMQARGWKTARVDFTLERLVPTLGGAFNGPYLALIQTQVNEAQTRGMRVVLDMHNYGGYATSSGVRKLGSAQFTSAHFADAWTRIANVFKDQDTVLGYELMNEPEGLPGGAATWESASIAAYNAIRAVDPSTEVWVAGHNFQKVQGWTTQHPDPWIPGPVNVRYVAHHYFDTESSPGGAANSVYQGTSTRGGNYTYQHGVLDSQAASTGPPDAGAFEFV